MTEFALILPILVLLLFGIIQFGIAFNHYLTVTDAARAGARKAVVSRHTANPVGPPSLRFAPRQRISTSRSSA